VIVLSFSFDTNTRSALAAPASRMVENTTPSINLAQAE
jgi:hypothetical protein